MLVHLVFHTYFVTRHLKRLSMLLSNCCTLCVLLLLFDGPMVIGGFIQGFTFAAGQRLDSLGHRVRWQGRGGGLYVGQFLK